MRQALPLPAVEWLTCTNYFGAIYEARYVAGVVAGLKINAMIADGTITEDQAKIGYVGAFPFAEVVSGYTSFFLGVRSVCPSATMIVKYTNSWGDFALEKEAAEALIARIAFSSASIPIPLVPLLLVRRPMFPA